MNLLFHFSRLYKLSDCNSVYAVLFLVSMVLQLVERCRHGQQLPSVRMLLQQSVC